MNAAAPRVLALILCDQAFQQLGTGKWCIMGSFGIVHVRELPTEFAPLAVYVSLADFAGGVPVAVVIRDPQGAVVYAMRVEAPATKAANFDVGLPFPSIPLRQAGSHSLELEVGGRLLALRSFSVRLAESQPNAG